jgi:hypothetical protein
VNEAIENHDRVAAGLLPQRKAWFYGLDRTREFHDLDVQENGDPSPTVTIRLHKIDGPVEESKYEYVGEKDGYLTYKEIEAP